MLQVEMSRRGTLPLLLAAVLAIGCGAKTGLFVPDGERDAEPDARDNCVEVDPETLTADLDLDVATKLLSADVFFLVDCTGSMRGEIANIQQGLTDTIVPGALAQIPDVRFGVGAFGDFPIDPYGERGDTPFEMRRAVTGDIGAVQAAIDGLPYYDGADLPESQVEALYQVATGEGLETFVPPAPGCPQPGLGYPCFREGSQPVIVLVTDAPFHNGPGWAYPYTGFTPMPHRYEDAVDALDRVRARVIGIASEPDARDHLEQLARATGAVDTDGVPLVYSVSSSGTGLDIEVVRGIESLALRVPLDVDAVSLDWPGDDLDATILIERIEAVSADPPAGVDRIEGNTFYNAQPGTRLAFRVYVDVSVIPRPPTVRVYPVIVRIRGNRVSVLREETLYIAVPGLDGTTGC
jgi:predicted small lipoprotein YifL